MAFDAYYRGVSQGSREEIGDNENELWKAEETIAFAARRLQIFKCMILMAEIEDRTMISNYTSYYLRSPLCDVTESLPWCPRALSNLEASIR